MFLLLTTLGCFMHVFVVEDECTYDDVVTRVESDVGSGDLSVVLGDTLTVARRIEYSGDEDNAPDPVATITDGVLTLPDDCDDLRLFCSIGWSVTLPAGADLDLTTGSGDIDVVDVDGSTTLETGSGDIHVSGGAGAALALSTGSGDLDASGDYASVNAETGSGDIVLSIGDSATSLWASTGSGDASIEVAGGGWAVEVDTGSGDITQAGVQDDSTATRTLHVETGSGDITIAGR